MIELTPQTKTFIKEHSNDDVHQLALQAGKYTGIDVPTAITQIAGRQSIQYKVPSWYREEDIIYPPHLPLEQCSSEVTARYKQKLVKGKSLVDLTGGFGIDCTFLSHTFSEITYIERQTDLCDIARHNFPTLALHHIKVVNRDSVDYLNEMQPVDLIFIDPARRNRQGGKTVAISDCEPDVEQLESLLLEKAGTVLVKLSPMLDLTLALRALPHTSEVHIVSVQNECKEILLLLQKEKREKVLIYCINFTTGKEQEFSFTIEEEAQAVCEYTDRIDTYLYEPNASILKAGAFKSIAQRFGIKKLHPNSHLYTSDRLIENFPGRSFTVCDSASLKEKKLLNGVSQAHITTRNFPLSAVELRKRLKLKDGGEIYLFATTLRDEKKLLVRCKKI